MNELEYLIDGECKDVVSASDEEKRLIDFDLSIRLCNVFGRAQLYSVAQLKAFIFSDEHFRREGKLSFRAFGKVLHEEMVTKIPGIREFCETIRNDC